MCTHEEGRWPKYHHYSILHKLTSFFDSSSSTTTNNQLYLQDQKPDTVALKEIETRTKGSLPQKDSYCRWWAGSHFYTQTKFRTK